MGVPALFRWLSKKYPKIVNRVVEDTPSKVRGDDGEIVEVPIRYESKNPNGFEVDNLYLDMNGIVHPCTHPEGKPAPETEEDMMVEIFAYTERVVNMARPRKVLMMAIDGVAPRAKMNQQRSRRFRAAQEAADKAEEQRESIRLYEAMGHTVSEETRNKKSWDSNAITPGTPFMDLLSQSLKYWISYKLSTDPGWRDLKIIISDSSVPGEGEHKIVDWIRRQRTYPDWDPNTSHVMYGLDADLIMLGLATHEPYFRVLREDVFFQGSKEPQVCKRCGESGHIAANCKGQPKMKDLNVVEKAKPVDPKPFIFLDISVLREYLQVELNLPGLPFPFNLELAIDDWIFMIFFVGNDFLPHLPSLEIREGAIDVLLKIWRAELPRMGGYLTNHGKVNLDRAGIILEGLAKSEDEIFQKRKEDEERQESREKRRRVDEHRRQDDAKAAREGVTHVLNGQEYVAVTPTNTARGGTLHPSLPSRPGFDLVPKDEVAKAPAGKQKKMTAAQREAEALKVGPEAIMAMQGSNKDVVENRKAIRMANLSAAQMLKAELEGDGEATGDVSTNEDAPEDGTQPITVENAEEEEKEQLSTGEAEAALDAQGEDEGVDADVVQPTIQDGVDGEAEVSKHGDEEMPEDDEDAEGEEDTAPRGTKRKAEEAEDDLENEIANDDGIEDPPDIEADQPVSKKKLKVNPDGTIDGYVDDVKLWEPGYRERYYEKKFGVPLSDREFIDKVTHHYMEGLCWVLEYYYQGVPAWDWYYPYHYAPFAQDFQNVGKMDIKFEVAEPFKPFAQLLGVFPAASRIHLPPPLQTLMINEESPILDFYPSDFDIDMNGKKMAWQGVALLPFIDQHRLLAALASKEDELSDDEKRRNRWGDNVMFISEGSRLYDPFCKLYTLQAQPKPVPMDMTLSQGTNGSALADPACVPNSAFETPVPTQPECPDLTNNSSISVRYYFPKQMHPHKSQLLPGYRAPPPILTESDRDHTRRGGGGHRGGRGGGGPRHSGGPGFAGPGGGGRGGGGGYQNGGNLPRSSSYPSNMPNYGGNAPPAPYYQQPPPIPAGGGYGYGYGGGGGSYSAQPPAPYGGGGYGGAPAPYNGGGQQYDNRRGPGGPGGPGGYGGAPPAQPAYGGYGGSSYAAPPPRNPYAAPPPNPYGAPPPPAYGGGGRGGYNPYAGQSRGSHTRY